MMVGIIISILGVLVGIGGVLDARYERKEKKKTEATLLSNQEQHKKAIADLRLQMVHEIRAIREGEISEAEKWDIFNDYLEKRFDDILRNYGEEISANSML
ncbi:MAG: hypothetical protein KAU17_10405 [Spirochaetales bacterium]|nr:hypothetical protein [Spirochaetales bacterium]